MEINRRITQDQGFGCLTSVGRKPLVVRPPLGSQMRTSRKADNCIAFSNIKYR